MREIRTYGLNGVLRKRSYQATAPEDYQCRGCPARAAPDAGRARHARLANPALIRAVRRRLCGVRGGIMVTARKQGERMSGWSFRGNRACSRIAAGTILSAGV